MKKHSFLYKVAADLHKRLSGELRNTTVVFPNRRSGRVFQRHLAELSSGPIWSPMITTIDDFFKSHSRLTTADPLTLVSILHDLWNRQQSKKETFEQFYFFGKMIVSDFDLVDKHLINADRLFGHILELKEIEDAFALNTEDSEALKRLMEYFTAYHRPDSPGAGFLEFWRALAPIYHQFRTELEAAGLAYNGMIYREVVKAVHEIDWAESGRYIFVGFNRINRCEERLFEFLQKLGKADFYWNEDPHILSVYKGEAGKFLSNNLKKFPPVTALKTHMVEDKKRFSITPVPFQHLQAQLVVGLMKKRQEESAGMDEKTGVILNDEDLLMPLLFSIPSRNLKINVSAGLSLIKTPAYDLMKSIIEMHIAAARYNGCFHYRDIEKIFSNPCLPGIFGHWINSVKRVQTDERGRKKVIDLREGIYFSRKEVSQLMDHPLVEPLFRTAHKPEEVIEMLLLVMELAYEANKSPEEEDQEETLTFMQEVIRNAHQVLMRLRDSVTAWSTKLDLPLLKNLLRDLAQSRRIPFRGEPLTGIQIMGALESRNVNYDHLILPSLNEGIQPSVPSQSLIPYSLKKYFGLPVVEDEMADQAYYFRTLIAGATTIDILYDNSSSGMRKSEKSRFVQQIEYGDYPNWSGRFDSSLRLKLDNNAPEEITVKRSPEIQEALLQQLKFRGLSPSTFSKFLVCELQFYFNFILGADEWQGISDEVDARIIGSVFHKVMEKLYKPYEKTLITNDLIDQLEKKAAATIDETVEEERKLNGKMWTGYDLIAAEYLRKIVDKMLQFDRKNVPFTLVEHERELAFHAEINGIPVKFTGIVDRIHEKDKIHHIVDYKTGSADPKVKKAAIMPMGGNDQDQASNLNLAAIQTLVYCWLLEKSDEHLKNRNLAPSIYSIQKLQGDFSPQLFISEKNSAPELIDSQTEVYQDFKQHLESTFKSLLNPNRPFRQTKDEAACKYCSFKNICMR